MSTRAGCRVQTLPARASLLTPFPEHIPAYPPPSRHLSQPLATTPLFPISILLSFQKYCINGSVQYASFQMGLLSLGTNPWSIVRVVGMC